MLRKFGYHITSVLYQTFVFVHVAWYKYVIVAGVVFFH